jgi:hypothetical protein
VVAARDATVDGFGDVHADGDLAVVEFTGYSLDDAQNDGLEAVAFRIVVEDGGFVVNFGAAERRRSHAGINGCQMVMQGVEVLEEGRGGGAKALEYPIVAGLDAKFVKESAEEFQNCRDIDPCKAKGFFSNFAQITQFSQNSEEII